jgi:hypothetical protein
MEKIQELTTQRLGCPQVWCTGCYIERNLNECPWMRGMGPLQNSMGPSSRPMGEVFKVFVTPPFHTLGLYNTFLGTPTPQTTEYCGFFQTQGHAPRKCPIMQKYTIAPNKINYDFCASMNHAKNQCRALDALADKLDRISFRVNETPQGPQRG